MPEDNLIEAIFNPKTGKVYYSVLNTAGNMKSPKHITSNSVLSTASCYIDGGYLCYKSTRPEGGSVIFVTGRVFNWVAIE